MANQDDRLQLEFFGTDFAHTSGPFVKLYEEVAARRIYKALRLKGICRVLEIGPGRGALMAYLSVRGHEVIGLDVSPVIAQTIREKYALTVLTESLSAHLNRSNQKRYDAVIMCHVLEHFVEPMKIAKQVFSLLQTGGQLYVAVPNMDSWHSRWAEWPGYAFYHWQYFTRRSLVRWGEQAGLRINYLGSYESLSGWSNTLGRSMFRYRGQTANSGGSAQVVAGWKRHVLEAARLGLGAVLSPIRWAQAWAGKGEELVLIGTKP
jgi:SAM-dependent methyltransferase